MLGASDDRHPFPVSHILEVSDDLALGGTSCHCGGSLHLLISLFAVFTFTLRDEHQATAR